MLCPHAAKQSPARAGVPSQPPSRSPFVIASRAQRGEAIPPREREPPPQPPSRPHLSLRAERSAAKQSPPARAGGMP